MFIPEAAPDRTVVPDAPALDALLTTYTPHISVDAGEVLDPAPASIEKRIQRSTLPGGVRLALLPKATRGNRVQATLTLRFGDEHSLVGKSAAAQMAGALLMRGTKTMSRQQIQDEIQKLDATIGINGGLSSVSASIDTTAENLIPAMRLAVQILREPVFPASDFDQIRAQRIAAIDRGRTDPETLVSQMLQSTMSSYPRTDVRHVRTIDEEIEDLKAVTLEDVKAFYQQFYGASHGELVAVGKLDVPAVQSAAAELLGAWKSPSPYARIVNTLQRSPAHQQQDRNARQGERAVRCRVAAPDARR